MLGSHTSPSLIDDIFLRAYWSPRTTFGTDFRKRITPAADRWKLASRGYRQRILRFFKPEGNLPGLRTFKESANGPGIELNAALPQLCRDRRPRCPSFSQPSNLVEVRPELALERLRMSRRLHGKSVTPTRTRRRDERRLASGRGEETKERPRAKRVIRNVQRYGSFR